MSGLWIQPTGAALAADVHGVDLSQPVSDEVFARIAEAWGEHLVLRFSGQKLDDRMLMQFSARFGELDRVPISAASLDRADSEGAVQPMTRLRRQHALTIAPRPI